MLGGTSGRKFYFGSDGHKNDNGLLGDVLLRFYRLGWMLRWMSIKTCRVFRDRRKNANFVCLNKR